MQQWPGQRVQAPQASPQGASGVIRGPAPTIDPAQAANIGIAQSRLALDQEKAARERDKPSLTPAQTAVDKEFAKEYVAWNAGGGFADFEKQISQLGDAVKALKSSDSITGWFVGNLPDTVNFALGNEDAVNTREAVEEVVQRNLRLILGAQFTNEEGKRLIARAYNVRADEGENAKRVERLIKQMRQAAEAKADASRYFEENGTLAGWKGKLPTIGDFDPNKENLSGQRPRAQRNPEDDALIAKYLD